MNQHQQSHRRRALYTGLQPFLSDRESMEALLLWESRYAKNAKFALRHFVGDVAAKVGRPDESKKMLLSLVSSLTKPDTDLLPDPVQSLIAYREQQKLRNASKAEKTPEIEAFKLLVNKWLLLAQSPIANDIEHYVCSNLDRINVDPAFAYQFKRWVNDNAQDFTLYHIEITDLRKVINLLYIAICEFLGPTKADLLLHRAVTLLSSNGGAQYRSIFRKLL